jgi:hypothetical protein
MGSQLDHTTNAGGCTFGTFSRAEVFLLHRIAHLQVENDALTHQLVQRENSLQQEKDSFIKSISATCDAFRVRAVSAEAQMEEVLEEQRRAAEVQEARCLTQDAKETAIIRQLQVQLSGIGNECKTLKNLLAQSETGMTALRRKQQQDSLMRSKADNIREKEKDSLIKKLQQAVDEEQSLCDGMQKTILCKDCQLATKEQAILEISGKAEDAENAARQLASEIIQLSHLPPIIDAMQLYLKNEADKMYRAGLAGGLENFAKVALTFLQSYRGGALDRLIDEAVAERREKLNQNLAHGFEAGRACVMDTLKQHLSGR